MQGGRPGRVLIIAVEICKAAGTCEGVGNCKVGSRLYTVYHHRGKCGFTDEFDTERTFALVPSPAGRGRDFAVAGHLVQLEDD